MIAGYKDAGIVAIAADTTVDTEDLAVESALVAVSDCLERNEAAEVVVAAAAAAAVGSSSAALDSFLGSVVVSEDTVVEVMRECTAEIAAGTARYSVD